MQQTFTNGDPTSSPEKTLGTRFASPKKQGTSRLKRATKRALSSQLHTLHLMQPLMNPSSSTAAIESEEDEDSDLIDN